MGMGGTTVVVVVGSLIDLNELAWTQMKNERVMVNGRKNSRVETWKAGVGLLQVAVRYLILIYAFVWLVLEV